MTTLLDFLRTAEPVGNVWDYVSASRLNLWSKCPLAFRRRYVDGIESAPSVSMFVGKVVHGVLEHVYRCRTVGTICTESDLPVFVESVWTQTMKSEPVFFDDEAHEEKCRTQVNDLTAAYLREINIEAEKPLAVEKRYETQLIDPLTGEDLGISLVGIIDLLLEEQPNETAELQGRRQPGSNALALVDFKTAASASSNCEIQNELQLTAYSYLIRQLLDREESSLEIRQLVKTKTPKIVVHRFPPRSDEHFRRFFDLVREYLDNLDRGVLNYRPGFGCMMCDQSDGPQINPKRKGITDYESGDDWSPGKPGDPRKNAADHYEDHKADFPELNSVDEYVDAAHEFKHMVEPGKVNTTNGDLAYFDPSTNTFLITDKDGTPRSFFRPTDGDTYYNYDLSTDWVELH